MAITFLFFFRVLNCRHHNGFVSLNRCYCFCFQVGKQVQKGGVNFPKPHSKGRARIREPLPVSFGPWRHLHSLHFHDYCEGDLEFTILVLWTQVRPDNLSSGPWMQCSLTSALLGQPWQGLPGSSSPAWTRNETLLLQSTTMAWEGEAGPCGCQPQPLAGPWFQ